MVEYYVVLGDVVHSREIEDREAFQEQLSETCTRFTAAERDDVFGDFKILKGIDEFGGVLQSLANLYEVVTTLQDELRPHEVRIVVASGLIDVGLTSFDVEKMDGEAFHKASERLVEIDDGPMSFDLLIEDEELGRAVADEINLLLDRRNEWTDRQREVIEVRESVDTQTAAAERLDVTQQAVSNVLSGADWPLVKTVEDRLHETLQDYRGFRRIVVGDTVLTDGFEKVKRALESDRPNEALAELSSVLEESVEAGHGRGAIELIDARLETVVEPALTAATDDELVNEILVLLRSLADRTAGMASEDVRLWSIASFARLLKEPPFIPLPRVGGEKRAAEGYSTGLGFLLARESETGVDFFRTAWETRDELEGKERTYAVSAGAGLLGCAELLGPTILDEDPAEINRELQAENDALRKPAKRFWKCLDGDEVSDADVADAVHDDEFEQFSRLEAEAFATLYSQIRQQTPVEE